MFDCKVLICDSGLPRRYVETVTGIDIGLGVLDENGHGSQILEDNKFFLDKFEFYSMKILDKNKTCSLELFLKALDEISILKFDIVCLALAFECEQLDMEIQKLIEHKICVIKDCGTHILCSAHNKSNFSYPASFVGINGVKVNNSQLEYLTYNANSIIEFSIRDNGIICEALDGIYKPFSGNSRASSLLLFELLKYYWMYNRFPNEYLFFTSWCNNVESKKKSKVLESNKLDSEIVRTLHEKLYECFGVIDGRDLLRHIDSVEALSKIINILSDAGLKLNESNKMQKKDLETLVNLSKYYSSMGVESEKI